MGHSCTSLLASQWWRVRFRAVAITGMGGRLRAGKLLKYFTKPARSTQPYTLNGTENEYQPKCSDVLWLRSKGTYCLFHLWINVWVTGKTVWSSLIRVIPKSLGDEQLIIKFYANNTSFSCTIIGICNMSLKDMSLTHNVINDDLSLRCGIYSVTLVNLPAPCYANYGRPME